MRQQFKFILVLLFLTAPSLIISQSITKEKIENAEKLIDLKFTNAERDSMLGYLEEQKGNYDNVMKKLNLTTNDIEDIGNIPKNVFGDVTSLSNLIFAKVRKVIKKNKH